MQFDSRDFLLFLALSVAAWWWLRDRRIPRLTMVFVASALFYMSWNPRYIFLVLFSAALDFIAGRRIHAAETPRGRKAWLIVSLVGNLGLLGVFKYYNFFTNVVHDTLSIAGYDVRLPYLNVLLPVGISFYTFQSLSYTIDVYRRHLEPAKNVLEFGAFVLYFPQLVSGPITRASELLPQIQATPKLTNGMIGEGLFLIGTGLVKKVAIADFLSVNLVDRIFDNPELYTAPEVVIGLYGFTMQIYCDFSGYTDVARGSAKLMGLELPENFDRPYQATSPAEFWRRWHMTLSRWLRDYLYYPLGGSRGTPARAYFNLWLTMFLIGLWHGAAWTFVLYGILQATAMCLHRYVQRRSGKPASPDPAWKHALKIVACLQFVVFSRILFRATSIDNAHEVAARLVSGTQSVAQISTSVWIVLLLSFGAHYLPRRFFHDLRDAFLRLPGAVQGVTFACATALLSLVATSQVVPYIYFQF